MESLREKGALNAALDVDAGADILWTLIHPSTYWPLTEQRRWTLSRYEHRLADTLASQLLRR